MADQAARTAEKPSGVPTTSRRKKQKGGRRWGLLASFLLICCLPAILGAVYYGAIASDRYAAGSSFVVRGLESGGASDFVSSFTGLASTGSTTSDSYIIRRYLESPDLVQQLDMALDLRAHFSSPEIDILSRFDASAPFEDFVSYWQRRIVTAYDSSTGILSFEVQAFDADTAHLLATGVLAAADTLINELSEKARRDAVHIATSEVSRAETRLYNAQIALSEFRSASGAVDPMMTAQLDAELVSALQAQLSEVNASIQSMSETVESTAPVLRQLHRRADALQAQIDARRAAISVRQAGGAGGLTANALSEFEGLQLEMTFAQQTYASALTSLEQARMAADRQQRYLAVFSQPLRPHDAIYPLRLRNAVLVALAAFAAWAISALIGYAIRDHLS
ncbi:MAG: capsule biosynthesis protein [Paracoccaceae bacterium]